MLFSIEKGGFFVLTGYPDLIKMRPLTTRTTLTDSAKRANSLLRQNPAGMTQEQAQQLLIEVTASLQEHDNDPAHIIENKGYYKKLTTAAAKRSKELAWQVYHCQDRLRRLADPTYCLPGYTGRNSNRR